MSKAPAPPPPAVDPARRSQRSRRKIFGTFPAYPYIFWMILFTIVPMILVIYFAVTAPGTNKVTFDNIVNVGQYMPIFVRSIWLGAVSTVVCLLVAYPFAFIMSRMRAGRQTLMLMLVMLPMWMNFLLRIYAWVTILEDHGVINQILTFLHLPALKLIDTQGAVALGMVYNYLPFMILPLYTVMTKIDDRLIEAAQDLGSGFFNTFARVVLPLSMPGITSGITMVFVPAVSTFVISQELGGGSTMLVGDLIDQQFLGTAYNPQMGSAISLVLMVLILISMAVMNQLDDEDMEGVLL